MAKKSYQKMEVYHYPDLTNSGNGNITMTLNGKNSKMTDASLKLTVPKFMLPDLVQKIMAIAKADATVAIRFAEKIQEAVR